MKCWWIFFHRWTRWAPSPGPDILDFEERRCEKCGATDKRFVW